MNGIGALMKIQYFGAGVFMIVMEMMKLCENRCVAEFKLKQEDCPCEVFSY